MAKKNTKKVTRHIVNPNNDSLTICGRPAGKVLLWAKKNPPKADDATVCGRCKTLHAGAMKNEVPHKEEAEKKEHKPRTPALASLEVAPKELVATYKGTEHRATVNPDGTITFNGKSFNSPSRAGKEVTGREVDGWTFWSYVKQDGGLEKIDCLRKRTA